MCTRCLDQPGCDEWCTEPSNTGRGLCIKGSYRGPFQALGLTSVQEHTLDLTLCSQEAQYNWSYIHCPACQCNDHSRCINSSMCENCEDLTVGKHCESCISGYYGDPTNGGTCQPCKCNGHTSMCNPSNGKCYCTTMGIKGDHCHLCEVENRYQGNPLKGTCYYTLLIDYLFTFSLSQEDDRDYTNINFVASPEEQNRDLDMFINASKNNLNIIWATNFPAGTQVGEEVPIVSTGNIKDFKGSFSNEKFDFCNNPNITFYVYVSNFTWPIKVQIAFLQHSNFMDLVQFFVTFFSCFLSLLLVAAVVWKIKQSCWASRRRESEGVIALNSCSGDDATKNSVTTSVVEFPNPDLQSEGVIALNSCSGDDVTKNSVTSSVVEFPNPDLQQLLREMQQMASRPFATINVALETDEEPPDPIGGSVKALPKPIAMEPCYGHKAAVLSIFIRLPRVSGGIPPPGQSGLALASALVDVSQKMCLAYKEKSRGIRNRKQPPSAQPATCI